MGLGAEQSGLIVWIDGDLVPSEQAAVSVFDHSFNQGDAVFEGIKFLEGRVFDLVPHLERLYRSAGFRMITIPYTLQAFKSHVLETIRANGLSEGYLRIVASRGAGPLGLRNMDRIEAPTMANICHREAAKTPEPSMAAPGKRAVTVSTRRTPPEWLDPRIKSCNYLNNIMTDLDRRAAGVEFAVTMDIDVDVSEGPNENTFISQGDVLMTSRAEKCLLGIARQSIIAAARGLGLTVEEKDFTPYDVHNADELFSTGSLNDITWISEVNGRQVGTGKAGRLVQMILPAIRKISFEHATLIDG